MRRFADGDDTSSRRWTRWLRVLLRSRSVRWVASRA